MPNSTCLTVGEINPELVLGAKNAINTCLSVSSADRAVLITDRPTLEIASAIWVELRNTGAQSQCFVLEHYGDRPLDHVPPEIIRALESATVSLMIVQPQPGELKTRTRIMDLVRARNVRHAHMPGVDERMMKTGMRADYRQVAHTQDRLLEQIGPESVIHVFTPVGTDLEVRFTPEHHWVRNDGLIKPGVLQNLPSGQLYTTPYSVEGMFVGDGAIGEWFGLKYPDLAEYPLTVEISQGRVLDARSSNAALARQFLLYVRSNPGGDRVGEFAIGTNLALTEFLGNALQDENVPGSHLAFGGAAILSSTGARWTSKTHLPLIARHCDIDIDNKPVMRDGVFEPHILEG